MLAYIKASLLLLLVSCLSASTVIRKPPYGDEGDASLPCSGDQHSSCPASEVPEPEPCACEVTNRKGMAMETTDDVDESLHAFLLHLVHNGSLSLPKFLPPLVPIPGGEFTMGTDDPKICSGRRISCKTRNSIPI